MWLLVPLIILLTESKNRPFQRYHAIQSLGLSVVIFVVNIGWCILSALIGLVTAGLGCILAPISFLVFIAVVGVSLYYAYKAYQGEMFEIPVLTNFLKQQKWL
jgi:uncharacterized membrane protein